MEPLDFCRTATGTSCQISLQARRMFFTITLTHFALLALNRLFAICVPKQPCLVSKRAFIMKSLLGYGVPTLAYLLNSFLHGLEGSEIFYSQDLEACVHVTEDLHHVR